ncbi:hypothetical protein L1887_38240 [Cichorium endivia]|nr:hypothetical protein L1887_38240 [Cichorium endivia]
MSPNATLCNIKLAFTRFEELQFRTKDKSHMMKYKKGSIVEVLIKDNFCHHSWHCAQIVSIKGHNYTVSYNMYPGFTNKADVQQISIRPCPPLLKISESFAPGDVVEVFYNLSWKTSIVLKAFNQDKFLVRLLESSIELKLTKSELRVRQSFQNGEWIVLHKYNEDVVGRNSATSSSDSCSINSYNESGSFEDIEGNDSDVESVCEMRYDEEESENECVSFGDEIHRLELHAYRCTMEALHASGPLTWEKETMGQSSGFYTFCFCISKLMSDNVTRVEKKH